MIGISVSEIIFVAFVIGMFVLFFKLFNWIRNRKRRNV